MRIKLEVGRHLEGFAYIDLTITSKTSENIDNDKVYDFILNNLNNNTWLNFTPCDSDENTYDNEVQYINSIAFDYERGEMSERYKEIKTQFKEIKARIKRIEKGSRLKK